MIPIPYVFGRIAWAAAVSAVSAAALGCLVATTLAASTGDSNVRRPLASRAGFGNIARPFFPDGSDTVTDVPATDLVTSLAVSTEAVSGAVEVEGW